MTKRKQLKKFKIAKFLRNRKAVEVIQQRLIFFKLKPSQYLTYREKLIRNHS